MRRKDRHFPGLFNLDGLWKVWSIRTFDDRYTAPHHGYHGATDYYHRASAMRVIDRVARPALILSAADDPFVPPHIFERAGSDEQSAHHHHHYAFGRPLRVRRTRRCWRQVLRRVLCRANHRRLLGGADVVLGLVLSGANLHDAIRSRRLRNRSCSRSSRRRCTHRIPRSDRGISLLSHPKANSSRPWSSAKKAAQLKAFGKNAQGERPYDSFAVEGSKITHGRSRLHITARRWSSPIAARSTRDRWKAKPTTAASPPARGPRLHKRSSFGVILRPRLSPIPC